MCECAKFSIDVDGKQPQPGGKQPQSSSLLSARVQKSTGRTKGDQVALVDSGCRRHKSQRAISPWCGSQEAKCPDGWVALRGGSGKKPTF